jgi:hypothetical protein
VVLHADKTSAAARLMAATKLNFRIVTSVGS